MFTLLNLGKRYPLIYKTFDTGERYDFDEAAKSLFVAPIRVNDMFHLIDIVYKIYDRYTQATMRK